MGKAQGKQNTRRHNPIRVPDSHIPHGLAAAASTSTKTEAILPIIQKVSAHFQIEVLIGMIGGVKIWLWVDRSRVPMLRIARLLARQSVI